MSNVMQLQVGKLSRLSRREREVTQLVARGFRNREIGDELYISEHTVRNHMHNIFEKTGVQDRLELATYAICSGLQPGLQSVPD